MAKIDAYFEEQRLLMNSEAADVEENVQAPLQTALTSQQVRTQIVESDLRENNLADNTFSDDDPKLAAAR